MKKRLVLLLLTLAFTLSACEYGISAEESGAFLQPEQVTSDAQKDSTEEAADTESITATENTTATEDTAAETQGNGEEIPEAYTKILSLYSSALTERWNGGKLMENDLNYMVADCYGDNAFSSIGYAVRDIDGNGTPELVIGTTENIADEFYGKMIFDLYSMDETGSLTKILNSSERNRYYYAGESLFANVGANSASDSIDTTVQLENGTLADLGTVTEPSAYQQMALTQISPLLAARSTGNGETNSNSALELPILDEINQNTTVGTAGSSLTAVQSAVKLLDWGCATGLDPEEIREATVAWLSDKGNDEQVEFAAKMESVDEAYRKLLGEGAEDLLAAAGCEDSAYPWSSTPVEPAEAIMEAVGLR